MRRSIFVLILTMALLTSQAAADVGINIPLVGRLIGGGNTLFTTALDVSNQTGVSVRVDFFLDGQDPVTQQGVVLNGSIGPNGQLSDQGTGSPMRGHSNAHFDDFIDSLVAANRLPATIRTNGFLGSVLVVFRGLSKRGEAAVTARFYNRLGDGFVGVSLKGREVTVNEPQRLVATILDTRGNSTGAPQLYPNMFLSNIGLTLNGQGVAGPVTIEVSAISNSTGQAIGTPITITELEPGRTTTVSQVLNALQIPAGSETTILVFARVTSGNASIQGLISQVDPITRDGALFEMSRADF